jgi:Fic family protein
MNRLISEHNEKMLNPSISMEERLREILYFLYRFFIIHPFADANGRIGSILTDSMLIYHGHAPLYFKEKSDNDISFQTAIKKTILEDSFEDFCFTIYH